MRKAYNAQCTTNNAQCMAFDPGKRKIQRQKINNETFDQSP